MNKIIENVKENIPCDIFTDNVLRIVLNGTSDSRHSAVKRAVQAGDIIRFKRGVYALGPRYQRKGINLFQAAQMMYGPSYVSMESALAYHGWIPEAVYTITSVSLKRSREIKTPLGIFSYVRIPSKIFFAGISRIESPGGVFLVATPWRALADYVYTHKADWKGLKPVVESLRVDAERFKNVDFCLLDEVKESTQSTRVKVFMDRVKKELMT